MKTLMNSITCILLILSANGLLLNNSGKSAAAPKPAAKAPAPKPAAKAPAPKPAAKAPATKPAAKAPAPAPKPAAKAPAPKPAAKAPATKPAAKAPATKPAAKASATKPAAKAPEPTPETQAPEPTPETKAPEPTPETKAPEPTPETKAPEPTPERKAPEPEPQETLKNDNAAILSNIDYVLRGYNVVYGNPHSPEVDPGFGKVMFNASYKLGKVTGDTKYKILDGTDLAKIDSCATSATATQIKGAASYQSSLSVDVSVSGGLGPVSFQASAGYKQVDEETKSSNFQFREEKADCKVYKVSLNEINSPLLTDDFIEVLKILPSPYQSDYAIKYNKYLFKPYGTHCIASMNMGARYGLLKKFSLTATSKSNEKGANASIGGGAYGVSANVKIETNRKSTSSNENQNESETSFSIGSTPGDNIKDWLSQITTEMPIQYTLAPMDECLGFPKVEEQLKSKYLDVATFERNIRAALDKYCEDYLLPSKQVSSCLPPVDPVKAKVEIIQIVDKATYQIKNEKTGMCIDHGEVSQPLRMMPCDPNKKSEIWQFNYYSRSGDYRLTALGDLNYASMDVEGGWKDEKTKLFLFNTSDGTNQDISFDLDPETGLYTFKLRFSNQCLAVEDGSAVSGARVVQMYSTGDLAQKWRLIPANS